MTKRKKIIYWIFTIWFSLGMVSTAIPQVFRIKLKDDFISHLGYPEYFLVMLGVFKILGVIVALVPRLPLLKEWAYAGFFFTMIGALVSHIAMGDGAVDIFRPIFLLVLTAISWYTRPADRKLVSVNQ